MNGRKEQYPLLGVIRSLWYRKYLIFSLSFISGIVALVITIPFFMPDEYKATAEFVPPRFDSIKDLSFNKDNHTGIRSGLSDDLEHMVAVLSSDDCAAHIIGKFNLWEHYAISTKLAPDDRSLKMSKIYHEKIEIQISQYSTILITVYDVDPKLAVTIAKEFVSFAEQFIDNMNQRTKGMKLAMNGLDSLQMEKKLLIDSLGDLRVKYKLYNLDRLNPTIAQQITQPYIDKTKEFQQNYDFILSRERRLHNLEESIKKYKYEILFRKEHLRLYPDLITLASNPLETKYPSRPQRTFWFWSIFISTFILVSVIIILFDQPDYENQVAKQSFASLIRQFRLMEPLDKIRYYVHSFSNRQMNRRFIKKHPNVKLPPPYLMYESFKLDYETYYNDSKEVARQIIEIITPFNPLTNQKILDWGCGPARIIRHIPDLLPNANNQYFGTDYNEQTIRWCKENISGIQFSLNQLTPPLPFENDYFDVIYNISVFTHLSEKMHHEWFSELLRILKPGGLIMFTTHGNAFKAKLLEKELEVYESGQIVERGYVKEGHRTFASFQPPIFIQEMVKGSEIIYYKEGTVENDMPHQDFWIVKKSVQTSTNS